MHFFLQHIHTITKKGRRKGLLEKEGRERRGHSHKLFIQLISRISMFFSEIYFLYYRKNFYNNNPLVLVLLSSLATTPEPTATTLTLTHPHSGNFINDIYSQLPGVVDMSFSSSLETLNIILNVEGDLNI